MRIKKGLICDEFEWETERGGKRFLGGKKEKKKEKSPPPILDCRKISLIIIFEIYIVLKPMSYFLALGKIDFYIWSLPFSPSLSSLLTLFRLLMRPQICVGLFLLITTKRKDLAKQKN